MTKYVTCPLDIQRKTAVFIKRSMVMNERDEIIKDVSIMVSSNFYAKFEPPLSDDDFLVDDRLNYEKNKSDMFFKEMSALLNGVCTRLVYDENRYLFENAL